jgi:hypothetical protein
VTKAAFGSDWNASGAERAFLGKRAASLLRFFVCAPISPNSGESLRLDRCGCLFTHQFEDRNGHPRFRGNMLFEKNDA